MASQDESKFDQHCLVELFGHQRIAGRVTEQVIGGQSFVRVDVPQTQRQPAFTRFFGNGAIYSITPVSESVAQRLADQMWVEPVTVYVLPERQIEDGEEDEDQN